MCSHDLTRQRLSKVLVSAQLLLITRRHSSTSSTNDNLFNLTLTQLKLNTVDEMKTNSCLSKADPSILQMFGTLSLLTSRSRRRQTLSRQDTWLHFEKEEIERVEPRMVTVGLLFREYAFSGILFERFVDTMIQPMSSARPGKLLASDPRNIHVASGLIYGIFW